MIGLLPAAGRAKRMNGLPKFLLPIPGGNLLTLHYERMIAAGAKVVSIGSSLQNIDLIRAHVSNEIDTFVYSDPGRSLSDTVLNSRELAASQDVLFGMPDTYIQDSDVYKKLTTGLRKGADVVVGLFETRPEQRHKLGMCQCIHIGDGEHFDYLLKVIDKPAEETYLTFAWGVIAWKPVFWDYVYPEDATIGHALQRAVDAKLNVRATIMQGEYYDCGTPDEYFALIRNLTEVVHAAI